MLGVIRFILAFLVLLSHFPHSGMRNNFGVIAVICFYFISGFLMYKSYKRFTINSANPISSFYVDRILRLYPQYFLVMVLSFYLVHIYGPSDNFSLLNQDFSILRFLLNLFLLPVNYVFDPLIISAILPHPIVQPAWTLSTEFHFYLLLPFIFALPFRYWLMILLTSMSIIFSSFFFSSGFFNADNFGYRYIFGTLTVFLFGYSYAAGGKCQNAAVFIWLVFLFYMLFVGPILGVWENAHVQEVIMGGVLALPIGVLFNTIKIERLQVKRIDKFLGDLAYPIFLTHAISFYFVEKAFNISVDHSRIMFFGLSVACCLLVSVVLRVSQHKIEAYRIRRRGFSSLKTSL